MFSNTHIHSAKESKTAEIKYSALKAAIKYLQHTFGKDLLVHFKTDEALQVGQAATQIGVLLNHFRRVCKNRTRFNASMEGLTKTQQECFLSLYDFCISGNEPTNVTQSRQLKRSLSLCSVDSEGFPKIPVTLCSPAKSQAVPLDDDGFPLSPPTIKGKLTKADEEAFTCSPPPVSKMVWHGEALKRPASAKDEKDTKGKEGGLKKDTKGKEGGLKKKSAKGSKGTGNFKINAGTVKVGGGKNQTYLQHRPQPTASLQLICSITSTMLAGSKQSHSDLIQKLLPTAKQKGATKIDVVSARDKLLEKLV